MFTHITRIDDRNENVAKFVFTGADAIAEAVLYRYPTYRQRTVICCSTQSGCPVGCRFCGAGDSFVRSLTAEEIVDQVKHCLREVYSEEGVTDGEIERLQIMFMSMGEPMLNFKALEKAILALRVMYPTASLLISTSGPTVDYRPLRELSAAVPTVGLQFSVHESTDEARERLIPFRAKLNLRGIAHEGEAWFFATGRHPFFNYCAHDGNTAQADAERLFALFNPSIWCATVSVVCERSEGLPATNQHQRDLAHSFSAKLVNLGFDVRVFDPAGQDTIGGGCGQLWFVQDWMAKHPDMAKPSIGRGRPVVHAPQEGAV